MTTKGTTQSQQTKGNTSEPLAGSEAWQSMIDANVERMEAAMELVAKLQEETLSRLQTNVEDAAKLYVDGLGYVGKLQAQWRSMVLETARSASVGTSR